MEGLLVVGHGSLRPHSAGGMQRVAARLGAYAPHLAIETGFLNYGTPTVSDCAAALAQRGVRQVAVQPYFLTTGQYVQQTLPQQIQELRDTYPEMQYRLQPVLGEHAALPGLLYARLESWYRTLDAREMAGVVLVAHGSRFAAAVCQVQAIATRLQDACHPMPVMASYLDINQPDLATGCRCLLQQGMVHLAVLPCFLHAGRHVKEDLPRILTAVSDAFPDRTLSLMGPVEDTRGLSEIILSHLAPCAGSQASR